jgi:hypothetical protein
VMGDRAPEAGCAFIRTNVAAPKVASPSMS